MALFYRHAPASTPAKDRNGVSCTAAVYRKNRFVCLPACKMELKSFLDPRAWVKRSFTALNYAGMLWCIRPWAFCTARDMHSCEGSRERQQLTGGSSVPCSGRVIKDIKWFFYFSTVFLLFVGAGAAHASDCLACLPCRCDVHADWQCGRLMRLCLEPAPGSWLKVRCGLCPIHGLSVVFVEVATIRRAGLLYSSAWIMILRL